MGAFKEVVKKIASTRYARTALAGAALGAAGGVGYGVGKKKGWRQGLTTGSKVGYIAGVAHGSGYNKPMKIGVVNKRGKVKAVATITPAAKQVKQALAKAKKSSRKSK